MYSTSSGRLLDVEVDLKDVDAVGAGGQYTAVLVDPSTVPTAG
jgi:hypothetical protein